MPVCPCCICQCRSLVGLMYRCYYPVFWPNAIWQKGKILCISVLRWSINGNLKLCCIKSLSSTIWPSGLLSLACSSKSPAAYSSPLGCSGGACELFPCDVFLSRSFFQLARSKQLMASCDLLDLHFSFLYTTIRLPLLALLWASIWWRALSMPRGAAGAAEEVKTAELLQQISSNSRLCCGSSVECHHFNCSLWNSS